MQIGEAVSDLRELVHKTNGCTPDIFDTIFLKKKPCNASTPELVKSTLDD